MIRKTFPLLLLAALVVAHAHADSEPKSKPDPAVAGSSFYADEERGWFWYEEPPAEVEKTPEKPPEPEPAVQPQVTAEQPELPTIGSVAWLKIMLPKLKEAAIDSPTEENIKAYFFAQRLMLDKAERFSRASIETIKNEPLLDEDLRYPASNAASDALAEASTKQKDTLLKLIAGDAALMLFFKGKDCTLCAQAVSALTGLENKYGFTVIPVSMDGSPLPGGQYPNTQFDNGLAKHLGVIATPAIALIVPPNDVRIVSYSTISMETASNRILSSAKDLGLISEQEFNATSRLAQVGLIDPSQIADAPSDPTKDPEKFVNSMRDAAARAFDSQNGVSQ